MEVCSLTDIGRTREMNQDYLYISEEPVGRLANLFLVADGMGGHNAGEFASGNAVAKVVKSVKQNKNRDAETILEESIQEANRFIKIQADLHASMKDMGTTIVAATIRDNHMVVANVGDSRLYVVSRDNSQSQDFFGETGIVQITKDHSVVQELFQAGELEEENIKNHPDKNKITRAVGVEDKVKVDFFEVELLPNSYVILCTDGLSNMIEDIEIRDILRLEEASLLEKTEKLIQTANNYGGKDNVTVVVIDPSADEVR